ncbi:TRP-domain-containing protein [Whalleya microplaca]|nr:TRP-domain-containing protein [Whalleya microplaca]
MLLHHLYHTLIIITLSALIPTTYAKYGYIFGTGLDGVTNELALSRTPALYTGDFGDCLGGQSVMNITKFDAAFYYDNSTILFHLDGTTNIRHEDLMLYISVEAYGETRFEKTVNPCLMNVYSLCPLSASQPIEAIAVFPVGPQQVSGIPQIAYEVPDIEGFARIQIFANSSQTEIGCFQAVLRNGHSFSQPKSISAVLGGFTAVAIVASFVTAAYGISVPHMRTHYAHSLPVLVIFETFQSIFYSGALTLPWPSVLPAWWSNFAWSAGLIPVDKLVNSIDLFVGVSGNSSQVRAAGSTVVNNQGGLRQSIYGGLPTSSGANRLAKRALGMVEAAVDVLTKRQPYNSSNPYDYNWNGDPVKPKMPLPGDWTGLPGVLSMVNIPAPNAFLIGFIWLLVALGLAIILLVTFKFALEAFARLKWIKQDRLEYFRTHWTWYLCLAVMRTLFISFFTITTLATFQFAIYGSAGPTAIAAIIFIAFVVGMGGLVLYTLRSRLRRGKFATDPDRILLCRDRMLGWIPWITPVRFSKLNEQVPREKQIGSLPFLHWRFIEDDPSQETVHQDESYVKRFGWLSARYRLSKWWFFAYWLIYQFIRACFLGGASANPFTQVFGLFVVDIIAFLSVTTLSPYESQRNTVLAVWLLGLTKLVTTGLSIAFLPDFKLNRISVTVIGVVIIVIQCLLTIAMMILMVLGYISSWMSLYRNQEYFPSERLEGVRIQYYEHIARRATDQPPEQMPKTEEISKVGLEKSLESPSETYFSVTSVRRAPKIEDEDEDCVAEINPSGTTFTPGHMKRPSRTASVGSRHSVSSLPRGARVHRVSWSSQDFSRTQADQDRPSAALVRRLSGGPEYALEQPPYNGLCRLGTPRLPSPTVSPSREEARMKGAETASKQGSSEGSR